MSRVCTNKGQKRVLDPLELESGGGGGWLCAAWNVFPLVKGSHAEQNM